ncbi:MAG: zinc ABC transporter substrate-binding protein [Mariniblastus sp.]|nr:zinc ABC transporter substrate-binding protein [Mariniblastus sp.]
MNQNRWSTATLAPLIWSLAVLLTSLCTSSFAQTENEQTKRVIVCSTTQIADFTRQIVGDRWEVVCVLAPGEDPHTYEVGADDSFSVQRADLCIENGWNLEGHGWMANLARDASKPIVTCVDNIEPLKINEESAPVNDPHAWFDTKNASTYVINIRNAISKLDPEHAEEYAARTELYLIQLRALNHWIQQQVNAIPKARRILVTHHDAFGYFGKAYGFKAISPVGWTTGELSGVSVGARQEIVKQIRDLGVKSIFVETSINRETLDGIARETGISIGGELYSDAMGARGTAGETYIGMMRENVLTIVNHLK